MAQTDIFNQIRKQDNRYEGGLVLKVAVVGAGRVGLPLAAVSSKYFDTIAVDVDGRVVQKINEKENFSEPSLTEYLKKYNLEGSVDFDRIKDRDLVFVCVGSQSPGRGYSAKILMKALEKIAPQLNTRNQVLAIVTTLPLPAMEGEILPYLASQNVLDRIEGICYSPTMIALGNAIEDFEQPNYLLIGESEEGAGQKLQDFWRRIIGHDPPIFRSTLSNIVLAKYVLNTALVLKITLMNTVTELCERAGGDIDLQAKILQADPRIAGPKMFKGGLGYGGTCYPVDVDALRAECERLGFPTSLADSIKEINSRQVDRTVELIESFGKKKVAILGVTYKPDTSIVVASQPLEIAARLMKENYEIMICDPKGIEEAKQKLGSNVLYTKDTTKALAFGNIILLGVEWPQFRKLDSNSFRRDQIVVDPWRMLRARPPNCTYVPFGIGAERAR